MEHEYLTIVQVAKYLNSIGVRCSAGWIEAAIIEGRGPSYIQPSARKIYFLKTDIDAWRASWTRIPANQPIIRQPLNTKGLQ
jgi:hypothetical protein